MRKFLTVLLALCLILICFSSCNIAKPTGISIVATNFPAYDFAKNVLGDRGTVTLLLPPGGESHTYEPTAKDIVRISECDLFIYNGGESDTWVDSLLYSLEKKPETVKMMDFAEFCHEEHSHEGHSHETDEHIWTSLRFSSDIISGISHKISELDIENSDYYKKNSDKYISEILSLDKAFTNLFSSSKRKTIVVADRFPFTYFAKDYSLSYYSAYHSCSEDAEPTPQIIAELIDTVKSENIPIIFHLEFSNKTVASAVAEDTGAKVLMLHSCHNITKEELSDGVTYLDLMKNNYEVLKEAVNL